MQYEHSLLSISVLLIFTLICFVSLRKIQYKLNTIKTGIIIDFFFLIWCGLWCLPRKKVGGDKVIKRLILLFLIFKTSSHFEIIQILVINVWESSFGDEVDWNWSQSPILIIQTNNLSFYIKKVKEGNISQSLKQFLIAISQPEQRTKRKNRKEWATSTYLKS